MSETPRSPSNPRWTAHDLPPDSPASSPAPAPAPPERHTSPRMHVLPGEGRGDRSGTVLADQWDLLQKIGSGGMGDVYEARFRPDRVHYAIKLLTGAPARDPIFLARFEHEYRALSQVRHPSIVRVFYFGAQPSGERFYSMELLRGATLEEHIRRGPLAPARVVAIGLQLCDALALLHARGVIHRDLKPANIFLLRDKRRRGVHRRDRVKLLDLGIAKLTAAFYARSDANATPPEERLRTRAGVVLGTPGYIAPEVARGDEAHPRQDIFALGVTLFKLATGAMPYAHPHAAAALDPPRPAPRLPRALERVLHTAIAADASVRYASIAELKDDLELVRDELADVASGRETLPRRASNPATPRPHRTIPARPHDAGAPMHAVAHGAEPDSAPSSASPPAQSLPSASTPPLARATRWLPWLISAALALAWFADAHILATHPGDAIAGALRRTTPILAAAHVALARAPRGRDADRGDTEALANPKARSTSPTSSSRHASPAGGRPEPAAITTTSAPRSINEPPTTALPTTEDPPSPTRSDRPTRSRAQVLREVAARRPELDFCIPDDGPIDLRLVIAADGQLVRATITPARSTFAQACIDEALAELRLPAAGAASTHTIRLRPH